MAAASNIGIGPLRVADADVVVTTNDAAFAAVASWSFRDLIAVASVDDAAPLRVQFDVVRTDTPWTRWAVWRDGEPCETMLEHGYVLFHLQWELNRLVLERRAATLHAAAVEIDGLGVVLCGSSHSGKTTFAGFLAAAGFGYVADEVAALTPDGELRPYRRPLGLRHDGPLGHLFSHPAELDRSYDTYEMLVPVSALGASIGVDEAPVPVGAIVFPRYSPNEPSSLDELDKPTALTRLCASSPGVARHGKPVFRLLAAVVERVPVAELALSDLSRAQDLLTTFVREQAIAR